MFDKKYAKHWIAILGAALLFGGLSVQVAENLPEAAMMLGGFTLFCIFVSVMPGGD